MASTHDTIRVLILDESQNDAEKLISLLRNAGHATRAHRITSEEQLIDMLKEQSWDLILTRPHSSNCTAQQVIAQVKRLGKDTPVILISNNNSSDDIVEGLTIGARDVVPFDEEDRLSLVIKRELGSLQDRRGRRAAEIALHEAEKRCDLLLDNSKDPIAYVLDGMHVYANQAYMQMFGHQNMDELASTPLIDMVSKEDAPKFKDFIKHYHLENGNADFSCACVQGDGSKVNVRIRFSPAVYDEEKCTQIILSMDANSAELEAKLKILSSQDLLTGLANRQSFLDDLDNAVEKALKQQQVSALCYIHLDEFAKNTATIGMAGTDNLLTEIANLLKSDLPPSSIAARLSDNTFTLLIKNADIDAVMAFAGSLCQKIKSHSFEIAGLTINITCSISVVLINENTPIAQEIITRAIQTSETLIRNGGNAVMQYQTDPDTSIQAPIDNDLIKLIEDSLLNNKFTLLFQPIVSLRGDTTEFYEVLLRLPQENGEFIPPRDLFNATKQVDGLTQRIDRWVIESAAKTLYAHKKNGHHSKLFINLTAESLQDHTLLLWINGVLQNLNMGFDSFVFQFNENDAVMYLKQAKAFSQSLAKIKGKSALTNFGCALNPIETLKQVAVDFVKLDGSFTINLQNNKEKSDNIKNILNDIHHEKKQTIMPLVENATILSTLWQAGVYYIQGYYIQPPNPSMNYDFSSEDE